MASVNRRQFLAGGTLSLSGGALLASETLAQPSERVRVGCVGVGGRAGALVRACAALREVELVTLCDLDPGRLAQAAEAVEKIQGRRPRTESDFRRLVEDRGLDALVVGTPDHWHALPTILGCMAGKDVYVEKPDAHNIVEGRTMVAAARKHNRIVQLGTQARTSDRTRTAMEFIRTGALGKCRFAKAWESSKQGSIGRPPDGDPPPGIDYDFWLGSAPKRPFNPRRFHGNWRWFFDYGTGDLGNDGVHRLDVARWALSTAAEAQGEPALGLPSAVSAAGGKFYFDDLQEWPDTMQVTYEYPGKLLTYEMRVWAPYDYHGESEGAVVYGEKGYIVIGNSRWRAYERGEKLLAEGNGGDTTTEHLRNFFACVKSRARPNADLETVGHISSVLCHAGNVAWRAGKRLTLDPKTERFDDRSANEYRSRPVYRKPWVLPEFPGV
ncbi:MAG: Gfo/Idh/MocA family oxidoreductase [Armatimonadetes bacterium]|nr:Gfo/Idh/MocA family oxidoreductase [Armatimonadota bacterium]